MSHSLAVLPTPMQPFAVYRDGAPDQTPFSFHDDTAASSPVAFMKGPKRKRLAKACDACHKSKRRCDGTAPCSNCYFATKKCTYTDASGRPVPAPRPLDPEKCDGADSRHPYGTSTFDTPSPTPYSSSTAQSTSYSVHDSDNDSSGSRKRFRFDHGPTTVPSDVRNEPGPSNYQGSGLESPVELDHALTRELTNLFFTHCHPCRMVIHKPSFTSALSHNRVPLYLLRAVCALAAPLSKQPRIRTIPCRMAGKPLAQEAAASMFDSAGRLVCEPNLATAQALCLLRVHDWVTTGSDSAKYRDLALSIIASLGLEKPEHPTLTPVPSAEFIEASIERECVRRIFWLIQFVDMMCSLYTKRSVAFSEVAMRLRLPVDETSFELAVHSTLPEYMYLPAVKSQCASELGHLIRIFAIYSKVEVLLHMLQGSNSPKSTSTVTLPELDQQLEAWVSSLASHLQFSDDNLQVQLSMFETSSNAGAWCFFCIHIYHASCVLALHLVRSLSQTVPNSDPSWANERLNTIVEAVGSRARNSIMLGAALWSMIKYSKRDDSQLRAWTRDWEEFWGGNIYLFSDPDLRRTLSPRAPPEHTDSQKTPLGRISDSRRSGSSPVLIPPLPPRQQQHGGEYTRSSPPAYPLGRSLHDLRLHVPSAADARPSIADTDIDPSLQGAGPGVRGGGGGGAGERDGSQSQSLPSLKASGLLDSWSTSLSLHTPRMEPKPGVGLARLQTSHAAPSAGGDADTARSGAAGMPVGMRWLAHE